MEKTMKRRELIAAAVGVSLMPVVGYGATKEAVKSWVITGGDFPEPKTVHMAESIVHEYNKQVTNGLSYEYTRMRSHFRAIDDVTVEDILADMALPGDGPLMTTMMELDYGSEIRSVALSRKVITDYIAEYARKQDGKFPAYTNRCFAQQMIFYRDFDLHSTRSTL